MPPVHSVIVSTRDPRSSDLDWHRKLVGERVELIVVENVGRCGLGAAYNEGLARARGEFCCFVHDDARVWTGGWLDRLAHAIVDDAYDLIGVAGTTRMPRTGGWWDAGRGFGRGAVAHLHPDGRLALDDYGPADDAHRNISPVVSLDGVLLFGRRRDFLSAPFDTEFFDGFHFYDSDLSLRWLLWHGKRIGVVHGLDVVHRAGASLTGWQPMLNRFHYRHGGFLPLDLVDVEVWRDNLAATRHIDPTIADRLTSSRRPGLVLGFHAGDRGGIIARTEHGEVAIADEPLPVRPDPHASWLILHGAGSGDRIDAILRDDDRPLWVIEPETHLLCWLMRRYHWAEELYSGRLRWLIPTVDQPALAEVSLHELVGSLQQMLADRGAAGWLASDSYKLHPSFHEHTRQSANQSAETELRLARWPTSKSPSHAVTIVSPHCRIFNDLAATLGKLGCATRLIDVPDRPSDWSRTKYWHVLRQLREESTPVTILRNRVFLETADARQRVGVERFVPGRVVSWWWDEPTVSTALDLRDPAFRRPALAFARGLVSRLPPGSRWLPPAARMEFVQRSAEGDETGRTWALSFVGQSRFQSLRDHVNVLANALAYFDGRVGLRLARSINGAHSMRGFHDAMGELGDEMGEALARLRPAFPAQAMFLDYLWRMSQTSAFRLAAVETLRKFPMVVFGDEGWLESGAIERDRFAGLVAPDSLAGIYDQTRLNLNFNFMQVSTTVNPKVLDISASGNAVLTDHRPELDELFPNPAARPPSFRTLDELADLVSTLLASDLSESRRRARDHVRAEHTMVHRARWFIREYDLPCRAGQPSFQGGVALS